MQTLSRRQFAQQLATGSLALALPHGLQAASVAHRPRPTPVVGFQLYGWGQCYDRDGRNMDQHLPEVLKAHKDSGYDYAEGSLDTQTLDNNKRFAVELAIEKGTRVTRSAVANHQRSREFVRRVFGV